MTGVIVLVVVLLAATAFGWWRRATDGRMRPVGPAAPAAPAAAAGDGSAPAGQPVPLPDGSPEVDVHTATSAGHAGEVLDAATLGASLGERATLVQFSTAFCQPCRATRVTLDEVARLVDGVAHVEVDAESHLDLVRRFDVMRTPTVLVLDAAGRVRKRAAGQPRRADVIAALGDVM